MEENRIYPCDEPEENRRIYPCDEPVAAGKTYPCDEPEKPQGKGKRGGNSGFSVVKHSGNFKERPVRHGRSFGDDSRSDVNSRTADRESSLSGQKSFADERYSREGGLSRAGRDFGGDRHFSDRSRGFGERSDGRDGYRDFRSTEDRSTGSSGYGEHKDRYTERGEDRNYGQGRSGESRFSRDGSGRRARSFGEDFCNSGSRGSGDRFGERSGERGRYGDRGARSFGPAAEDFSSPFLLPIVEVNEFGAFVELPEGTLKRPISGVKNDMRSVGGRTGGFKSGAYGNDSAGGGIAPSTRVMIPFSEQLGRPEKGDTVRVRFYADKGGRLTATMREPILKDGEVGILKVADVTRIGIFLDNGVPKQVLLPFREQIETPEVGDEVLVYLYRDKSGREAATMRVYRHLDKNSPYKEDDKVTGFVYEINKDMGVFIAVDNRYYGMIPIHEAFKDYQYGDRIEARVARVRDDGKLDLLVREKLYLSVETDADAVMYELKRNGGTLPYADKADADFIEETYAMSKNQFKRALGYLYKKRLIEIDHETDSVKLV